MEHNKKTIEEIANQIEKEYLIGGLADGIYLDFATDVAIKYSERRIVELINSTTKQENLLSECALQLEYLNEKFGETGTTNALLSKIKSIKHKICIQD